MSTAFWMPGIRGRVNRTSAYSVVDVTLRNHLDWLCVAILWQPCDKRGRAHCPPVSIGRDVMRFLRIPSERISEGRIVLPAVADEIWPQCYVTICDSCQSCQAHQNTADRDGGQNAARSGIFCSANV